MPDAPSPTEKDKKHEADDRLNSMLAVIIAVVATILGICNVKDGNIVQAMQIAQSEAVDTWAFFQAKSIKQSVAEGTVAQMETLPSADQAVIAKWRERVARYEKEKAELKEKAEALEAKHEALGVTDDQFDFAEAFLSISIALFGVAALVKRMLLVWFGAAFALSGTFFAIAGFAHLPFHPGWLASLLG